MWPVVIAALIGAIAGALRADKKDQNIWGGAAKGALIGGSLGYGGTALAGMYGAGGAGAGAGAGGAGAGAGASAGSSGFMQYLPQIGSFLASNYSPSSAGGSGAGAMSAYSPQTMQDPWGGFGSPGAPIQMLPSSMGGSIPGAQAMTPTANSGGGMDQLLKMFSGGSESGKVPGALGSPDWPRGVSGYGHGDMRKIEGLQMPEIPKTALPSLIAMLSRMQ